MRMHVFEHQGYEIVVQPEQKAYGAWLAKMNVRHANSPVAEFHPRLSSRNGLRERRRSATASIGACILSITSWKSRTTRHDGSISGKQTNPGRVAEDATLQWACGARIWPTAVVLARPPACGAREIERKS